MSQAWALKWILAFFHNLLTHSQALHLTCCSYAAEYISSKCSSIHISTRKRISVCFKIKWQKQIRKNNIFPSNQQPAWGWKAEAADQHSVNRFTADTLVFSQLMWRIVENIWQTDSQLKANVNMEKWYDRKVSCLPFTPISYTQTCEEQLNERERFVKTIFYPHSLIIGGKTS